MKTPNKKSKEKHWYLDLTKSPGKCVEGIHENPKCTIQLTEKALELIENKSKQISDFNKEDLNLIGDYTTFMNYEKLYSQGNEIITFNVSFS
jgi:hypothetical protein